ncbi:glycosyltransferase family 4 protein [Haloferula chungangensis]|uniref:Glycosyltransferase family 4 protein n=1 Tax=Haloferula chungangensis TaxID=1048331 RepID=A0ABW2L6Q5_9BACT
MNRERKHVCILAEKFPARSETFILEHAIGLARRGYEVTVVSGGPADGISDSEVKAVSSSGVRMVQHARMRTSGISWIRQIAGVLLRYPVLWRGFRQKRPWNDHEGITASFKYDALRQLKPDVVHIHFGYHALSLHRLGARFPTVVTWHGLDANVFPRWYGEGMYEALFSGSGYHTVGSDFMAGRLRSLGARDSSVTKAAMGVDLTKFPMIDREPSATFRIVSVGRLDEMKGHKYLIDSVSQLMIEGLPVSLRIVGEGPMRKELERQIEESGQGRQIELLGARTSAEILDELRCADLFALTGVVAASGRVETQGVAFIEAQATGLPVVACDVGGVSESLIDGNTGILCKPGDVASIKGAIKFFWENPEERIAFGLRGRDFVKKRFSIEGMLDRFGHLYERIAGH